MESFYDYKCLDLNLQEMQDQMVKIYFDYHWWGYAFHKTVLNGFITNDKTLDLSRDSDDYEIVKSTTNVEANKIVAPAAVMNGEMRSKEFRVKMQDIKVVKNYYSIINPLLYREDVAFRTETTSIYEDPAG